MSVAEALIGASDHYARAELVTRAVKDKAPVLPTIDVELREEIDQAKQRYRVFCYDRYLELLNEDTTTPGSQ